MPFLLPNQQRQSTEGNQSLTHRLISKLATKSSRKHREQWVTYLLLRQLFGYGSLLKLLIPLHQSLLHTLDAVTLDIARADQDALQRSQTKVIV